MHRRSAPLKVSSGVTVDDIAKRLIDYGFHAPTMSFPVPGTLMIEPTESESQGRARSLLRRHDRDPAGDRRDRKRPLQGRGLAACATPRTPCTTSPTTGGSGPIPAPRAAFPTASRGTDKYWSPVGRVDNVYGDRNLVCSCPPVEDYAQAAE
jgi:glycine dehydrogenase